MNWLQKLANQDLVTEFTRRWNEISNQKRAIAKQLLQANPPNSYYEQVQQDAEVDKHSVPAYQELIVWMDSQSSFIQDPGFAQKWNAQMVNIQQKIQEIQGQVQDSQVPWNPADYNLEEVLEWYADNGMDIVPVLDEFGINYEEVEFPQAKVLVFESDTGTYVYEDDSITEAHEWVNEAEPLNYLNPEPDDDFWKTNQQGFIVYHGTPEENVESIMRDGLSPRDETRGISNKSTGHAVFTSDNTEEPSHSYDVVIAIDVGAMQTDGYTPPVQQEEPIEEKNGKESLAWKLGLEGYHWEVETGISDSTYIFYGSIPPKYLQLL